MKQQNISPLAEASTKFNLSPVSFQFDLPRLEMILQTKAEIEALSAQAGLKIIHHFMEEEIQHRCGPHGQQSAYRHGQQPGYIVYAGRKVCIPKPRMRAKDGGGDPAAKLPGFSAGRLEAAGRGSPTDPIRSRRATTRRPSTIVWRATASTNPV